MHQYTRVGRYAFVGAMAATVGDVIPYAICWGNHARLQGLNLIGLKRRGFSRDQIKTLRDGYASLFAGEGTFHERVAATAEAFAGSPEVMEIVDFIRVEDARPLCQPASHGELIARWASLD